MPQNPDQPDPRQTRIRVGFISAQPLDDANHLSGMPHRMARALQSQGIDIVSLCEHDPAAPAPSLLHRIARRISRNRHKHIPVALQQRLDEALPGHTRKTALRHVEQRSATIQQRLDETQRTEHLDAIFGCCVSSTLYALRTDLPIIYFSDATSFIIRDTYPQLAHRGETHRQTLHQIEQTSVERAQAAIFASPVTRDSAVNDLGIARERTHVVPMGAHVTPNNPSTVVAPTSPPTRADCRLLIVAADPVRKRVDLALDATELLRQRGINATLHVVGPGTQRSSTSPAAVSIGSLQLADPDDRATHQQLLRDCHLQLLPSLGEAFGIAPIESAHFARPSIVAGAGGLSFVVQHDATGIVIDPDATAAAWADAIESLIDQPDRYRSMSTRALQRALRELNWDAWGRSVAGIIRDTVANHR